MQLIQGQFTAQEALDIITQMINVKIKFHENKINNSHAEEDIKMREKRIKQLQQELQESRDYIQKQGKNIALDCELLIKEK